MLAKMWSNRNSPHCWRECKNSTATLEDTLAVSYKAKHRRTLQSSNHAPRCLPKSRENLGPHKNLYTSAHGSFIHNCQKLEATRMSFNRWMDKQTVALPCNGILFSAKKKWAIKPNRKFKCILLGERSQSKRLHSIWFQLCQIPGKEKLLRH